ncbi:ATP-binding protein [Micromonospora wenchangensis]|uniref:ATP-binding protein n=1 Tax=Micromonospora wenchangensis TaxID=1185415 RepID=UPI00382C83A9
MNAIAPQSGNGEVSNQISGGVFFSSVIQGRDIQVILPAEIRPALTGLPPASMVFTGRDGTVRNLREALRNGPGGVQLVTAVAGMAGIGKTELVLQIAHRALADGWFPGGVLFVDMFGYDPERRVPASDALAGWLSAIGIPGDHIPAAQQDRSRLWRSVLDAYTAQGRRLLLIIDNVASEDQLLPLLPGEPTVPVLVTSRHTLDLDARLHDLDVLTSGVDLLTEVIGRRRGPDDPRLHQASRGPLGELADLCAGLPLALRIVAALMADRPHLKPQILADRLRDDRHRLDGLSRQQAAVRAAFDLSYQHLTDRQALLFRLLPINPGPDIATTAAARLADLPEHQAAELLADLHRAHLISEPAPERWSMHDLLRLYAIEQQTCKKDEGNTEVGRARRRLYGYYTNNAFAAKTHLSPAATAETRTFTDRAHALAWLDAEHTNLIATATTAENHQMAEVTTHLAFALAEFLDFRRHLHDWITVTTQACQIAKLNGEQESEGAAWNNLSFALYQVRRFDDAIDASTHARNIFQQTGDRHHEGAASNHLGLALIEVRRLNEAVDALTHACELLQQTGDRHGEGLAWNNLGLALRQVRRFHEAIEASTHARDIFQQAADWHREGQAWGNLGVVLTELRRFDEAIEAQTHAQDLFHRIGDRHGEGLAWNNLGIALREVGRIGEAIEAHTRGGELLQQAGDRHGEGQAWGNLGVALGKVGRLDEAIEAHTHAQDLYRQIGDRHGEGRERVNLGPVLREMGRFAEAIDALTDARNIFQQFGDRDGEGLAWNNLGIVLSGLGRFDEAFSAHTHAHSIFRQIGDRHGEGSALGLLCVTLTLMGRLDEARSRWREAITALEDAGDTHGASAMRDWINVIPDLGQ